MGRCDSTNGHNAPKEGGGDQVLILVKLNKSSRIYCCLFFFKLWTIFNNFVIKIRTSSTVKMISIFFNVTGEKFIINFH
jgi:hypothetical protein